MKTKLLAILLMSQIAVQASTTQKVKSIVDPLDVPPSHELTNNQLVPLNAHRYTIFNFFGKHHLLVGLGKNTKHLPPIKIMAVVASKELGAPRIGSTISKCIPGGTLLVDPSKSRLFPINLEKLHLGIIYYPPNPPEISHIADMGNFDAVFVYINDKQKLTVFFETIINDSDLEDSRKYNSNVMMNVKPSGKFNLTERDEQTIFLNWDKFLNTQRKHSTKVSELIKQIKCSDEDVITYPIEIRHETGGPDIGTLYYLPKTIGEQQDKK